MTHSDPRFIKWRGFSLVELTIVLMIVALLTGGLMISVSAQRQIAATSATERQLLEARDALLGFAAVNQRLPCPARPDSTGVEAPEGGGKCEYPWNGFLPAATLGLTPTDAQGYLVDAWNNRVRYAISPEKGDQITTAGKIKEAWGTGSSALAGDLKICSTATGASGIGATADCASGAQLFGNAVAVVFSRGPNGGSTPTSADESANGNSDRLFVSHLQTPLGANEFDDQLVWLSPSLLYHRMITAGRLP